MLTVQDDVVVSLDYTLRLENGEVVDSSEGHEPLEFIQGKGNIIPGLERGLYGMSVEQSKDVVVAPEDGYGEYDSDLLETLPRSVFPPDMDLEVGMGFRMRTESGQVVVAYVEEIQDGQVMVNLNHPLAGKTLHFSVKIAGLRAATPEELQGQAAGCGCGCSSCGEACGTEGECGEDECEEGCCQQN